MDITRVLEADHRKVEELFDQIEKADGERRQPLIDKLVTALRSHMQLEEAVVYPAMQPVTGGESVQEARTEHQLVRSAIDDVERLAPDEPGIGAALDAAKAGVSHHVEDEEGETFPKLRREGADTLEAMSTPFMKKRMELGMPMEADALAAASSKDELVNEAVNANVDGAKSMTKAQLAEALADKMS